MKKYNVKCPYCGYVNRNLYLKETDGWMECINCGSDVLARSIYNWESYAFGNAFEMNEEDIETYEESKQLCGAK